MQCLSVCLFVSASATLMICVEAAGRVISHISYIALVFLHKTLLGLLEFRQSFWPKFPQSSDLWLEKIIDYWKTFDNARSHQAV